MNIFVILANGNGSINEVNILAIIGYLENPYVEHGLGVWIWVWNGKYEIDLYLSIGIFIVSKFWNGFNPKFLYERMLYF